jgi:hypothetical protein
MTPYVLLDLPPVDRQPVQGFVLGSVRHRASNLSLGSSATVHRVRTDSPDPRGRPFGPGHTAPYPVSWSETTAGRCSTRVSGFLVPFGVPAFASWVILRPPGVCTFLAVGLPEAAFACRTPSGLSRCPRMRCDRVGRPLNPGDGGARTTDTGSPVAACRLSTAGP